MLWPGNALFFEGLDVPRGYSLDFLRDADIQTLRNQLLHWYPDVAVGMESVHLREGFLEKCVLGCATEFMGVVLRHNADGVVSLLTLEKDVPSKTLWSRLGVLHPDHRRGTLGLLGPILLERAGRAMKAELVHYYATLKSRHQQVIAERSGFSLVGIVPAHDVDMVEPGKPRRVYEAHYAKVLAAPECVEVPARSGLTLRTQRLFAHLFPGVEPR